MVITHNVSMDLSMRGVSPRIDAVQDDKYSRNVKIWLYENGAAFLPPGGCCAVIRYSKPDGTGGIYDTLPDGACAWALNRNELTVCIAPQVCTAVGRVQMMVTLLDGDAELSTFAIALNVQERVRFSGVSEDYINVSILARLEQLEQDVADLKYVAIKITSFSCSPSVAELGSTVTAVALAWSVSKTPSALTLDGTALDSGAAGTRIDGVELTASKTWTLRAVDERGAEAVATASLTFLPGVYYGVGAAPESIDSGFILGLTKVLTSTRARSIQVNAGDDEYIWYCLPSRFGDCQFTVGGFDGGFDRVAVIDFTNACGYTESYDVYRSANAGLGNTTVGVS